MTLGTVGTVQIQVQERRSHERSRWTVLVFVFLMLSGFAIGCGEQEGQEELPVADAGVVRTFEVTSRKHLSGGFHYDQTPPVGGDHSSAWQECGYFERSIASERGVHSMEHGAVWITFRSGLGSEDMSRLQRLAETNDHVLVTRWNGNLPAPLVASAWGRQVNLRSAADPELQEFVDVHAGGAQAPEQGVPC